MAVNCEFNRSIFSLEKCTDNECGSCQFGPAEELQEDDDDDGEEEAEEDDDDEEDD